MVDGIDHLDLMNEGAFQIQSLCCISSITFSGKRVSRVYSRVKFLPSRLLTFTSKDKTSAECFFIFNL